MISPETQTFVSTTTRRSNLGHGRCDIPLDAGRGRLHAPSDASATVEQGVEALLPLVSRDLANAIVGEPVVDRLSHERGDRLAAALTHRTQRAELQLIEIDVCANHRLYTIHQLRDRGQVFVVRLEWGPSRRGSSSTGAVTVLSRSAAPVVSVRWGL